MDKKPIVPGNWKEYATDDVEIIERTWNNRNVQVAMRIPDDVVAIDVDVKGGALGKESLRQLMEADEAFAHFIKNTRCHGTQSGGLHLFGKTRPGLKVGQRPLADGIDLRSQGLGYVVAPPSAGYSTIFEKPILELPDIFYTWYSERERRSVIVDDRAVASDGLGLREHSGRNNALTSHLGKIWHFNGNFSAQTMLSAARDWNDRNCIDPLNDEEMIAVVKSITERYESTRTSDDSGTNDPMCGLQRERDGDGTIYFRLAGSNFRLPVTVSPRRNRESSRELVRSPIDGKLYPVSDLVRPIHREVIPTRWLIPGLIPLRELTVLVGDSDVGKSYMMMALAAYLTSGEFCQFFPTSEVKEARHVFYFTREDDEDSTLLSRLLTHRADIDRLIVMDKNLTFGDFPALEGAIAKYRPALVCWDTAAMFLSGKTEMADQKSVVQDLEPLLGLARKYEFAVVVIAHLRKDSKGSLKDRIMSSIGFQTLARAAVAVTWKDVDCEESKTTRVVSNIKGNLTKEVLAHEFIIDNEGKVQFEISSASYNEMRRGVKDRPLSLQSLCDDWMRAKLGSGPILNSELLIEAEAHGFSKSHLSRSRSKHKAHLKRLTDGFFYTVPLVDEAMSSARSQVAGP